MEKRYEVFELKREGLLNRYILNDLRVLLNFSNRETAEQYIEIYLRENPEKRGAKFTVLEVCE